MLHELPSAGYERARPLFRELEYHLAVGALLTGAAPGRVFVDHPARPQSALAVLGQRFYLAGMPDNAVFNEDLRRLFAETIYPQAQATGQPMFILHYDANAWAREISDIILRDRWPIRDTREYYVYAGGEAQDPTVLPADFTLRLIDRGLLAAGRHRNLDRLMDEMCSERPSVDEFLKRSFGVCVVHRDDEIAAWCLSEYNSEDGCEVGIETTVPYRRRGLATAAARALIEHARTRGISHIGWDCWMANRPSAATAVKAGFMKMKEYTVYFAWYDEPANLAVNGNVRLQRQQYKEACAWFARACALPNVPGWAYWGAACAAARTGQPEVAFRYLGEAIDRGCVTWEQLQESEHLAELRAELQWVALSKRLAGVDRTRLT